MSIRTSSCYYCDAPALGLNENDDAACGLHGGSGWAFRITAQTEDLLEEMEKSLEDVLSEAWHRGFREGVKIERGRPRLL
jgi:hypothetical protein